MHHNFILKKTISSTPVTKLWPSQYEVGQEEGVFCTEAHTAWKSSRQDYDPNEYPSRSEYIGELVNQTPYRNSSPDLSLYIPFHGKRGHIRTDRTDRKSDIRSANCISLAGLRIFPWQKRIIYGLSIRTDRTDRKSDIRSVKNFVRSVNCISLVELVIF